jgi:hypothetical protein
LDAGYENKDLTKVIRKKKDLTKVLETEREVGIMQKYSIG